MKKPVGKYSLGMRQRLGIAQAIMEDPRFLILDEPFNGLDKHGVAEIRELLLDLKAAGKTILLASHNDEDIRILCDHVYEMDGGVLRERTDLKMGKKFVKTTFAILSFMMLLPTSVFAEDAGNMEAAFVGESVLEADQSASYSDADSTLPFEEEKKQSYR